MLYWLALVAAMGLVRAKYMTVGMSAAQQCNTSVVQWKGDDGPFHLLLTPTTFEQFGYNVWVPSIPNGTNSYQLPINLPAGLQFIVTVWGISGVEYAGTTDVFSVQPSPTNNRSCFLSEPAINNLYTFAFNISESHDNAPPQCSNLTISWPTSLKSDIDNGTLRRSLDYDSSGLRGRDAEPVIEDVADRAADDDFSSGANRTGSWNTTTPPTLFGIIPLGNSFSIPITYDKAKGKAFGLPDEYLSHDPTTWTSHGVTALNWTVNLAKGTRFILVAGIGSQEQWASGGSSEMMTVGQGPSTCFNLGGAPSITHSGSSTGALEPTDSPDPSADHSDSNSGGGMSSRWTGVILACVFSVLGTALLCILFWCCCRVKRERKQAMKAGRPKPSFLNLATCGALDKKYKQPDTQLDLMDRYRRDDISDGTPTNTQFGNRPFSMATSHGYDRDSMGSGDFANYGYPYTPPPVGTRSSMFDSGVPFRSSLYDDSNVTPYYHHQTPSQQNLTTGAITTSPTATSPTGISPIAMDRGDSLPLRNRSYDQMGADFMNRQSSTDGMVTYPPMAHSLPPLKRQLLMGEDENSSEQLVQLKRDTLAALDRNGESSRGSSTTSVPAMLTVDTNIDPAVGGITPSPLSGLCMEDRDEPRDGDAYVVHRDAGRIPASPTVPQNRVVELPPRYEELNWDREASGDVVEEAEAQLGTTLQSPVSPDRPVRHPLPLPPGAGAAIVSPGSPRPRSPGIVSPRPRPRSGSPSSPLSTSSPISPSNHRHSSPLTSPRPREPHGII